MSRLNVGRRLLGSSRVRRAVAVALAAVPLVAATARGDIYTLSGQLIPGTEGIFPTEGINLSGFALDSADLTYAQVSSAFFIGASLNGASFYFAGAERTNFTSASLRGTSFANTYMPSANLTSADLTGANLGSANLINANFSSADLTGASINSATVYGAKFTNAKVRGADLSVATDTGFESSQLYATASHAARDLSGTNFAYDGMSGWNFSSQSLLGCNFYAAGLQAANLRGADLRTAYLRGASLNAADLTSAKLDSADLSASNLTNANLSGATIVGANLDFTVYGGFASAQLYATASYQAHDLRGVDLSENRMDGWSFRSQNLTGATMGSGYFEGCDFTGATLAGVPFTTFTFFGSDMPSSLRGANLTGAAAAGAVFYDVDFTGATLAGTDLTSANLRTANLFGANLAGATIVAADLSFTTQYGFSPGQFYSTASYQALNLRGVGMAGNDLTGWNFANRNLSSANFTGSDLSGANFAATNLSLASLADAVGFSPSGNPVMRGTVMPDRTIAGFALLAGETLAIRDMGTDTAGAISGPGNIRVEAGSSLVVANVNIARLSVDGGVTIPAAVGPRVANVVSSLAVTGKLDLTNNDLVVRGGSMAAVTGLAAAWYDSGLRDGNGLASSLADGLTTLGVALNSDGRGHALYSTFDGAGVGAADVLVKYTYVGDTDLSGSVDGADLANLLAGMNGGLTGWVNGDVNYDGVVNGGDFALLVDALAHQGAPFGGSDGNAGGAVPEPALTAAVPMAACLRRRRRR